MAPVRKAMTCLALAAAGAMALPPGLASAAPDPSPQPGPTVSEVVVTANKTLSELTVTAKIKCLSPDRLAGGERPKVVSAFPGKGAVVRPGLLIMRVTFDKPMACDGLFAEAHPLANPCPDSPQKLSLSYDRRTVRTVCIVAANARYGAWVSADPNGSFNFVGLTGLPSEPYRLDFMTSAEPEITTVCEALSEDTVAAAEIRKRRSLDCADAKPATGGG
jgi:hypothetical protein